MSQVKISQGRGRTDARPSRVADMFVNTIPENARSDPKYSFTGTFGEPINVVSNSAMMQSNLQIPVYQYMVEFNPPLDIKKVRRGIVYDKFKDELGSHFIFDGTTLFSPNRIDDKTVMVDHTYQDSTTKHSVFIKMTGKVFLNSLEFNRVLNLLINKSLRKLDYVEIGRSHYDMKQPIKLQNHPLQFLKGYSTSAIDCDAGVCLTTDVSFRLVHTSNILNKIFDLKNNLSRRRLNPNDLRTEYRKEVADMLVGAIISTSYNDKHYKISSISFDESPKSTFEARGKEISYIQYYKQHYNVDIKDHDQILLVHEPNARERRSGLRSSIKLVPELCLLTGMTDAIRRDMGLMRDLDQYTKEGPGPRVRGIQDLFRKLKSNPEIVKEWNYWGLQVPNDLLNIKARRLPAVTVSFNPDAKSAPFQYNRDKCDWGAMFRGQPLKETVALNDFLYIYSSRDAQNANEFYKHLVNVGRPLGIQFGNCQKLELQQAYAKNILQEINNNITPRTNMVFVILPDQNSARYVAIKNRLCVENRPIPSQCVTSRVISRPKGIQSVATKVMLQVNVKLGGDIWYIDFPKRTQKMMVCGIDSYHDTSSPKRSVCGFVASLNYTFSRYHSRVCFQTHGQEIADGLYTCFDRALEEYAKVNREYPESVVVFRDGVGDGMLNLVKTVEVAALNRVIEEKARKIELAVVVVNKRINQRFFISENNRLENPKPGTVVDNTVTRQMLRLGFFLVPQCTRQGTVTPTYYNIVHNTTFLDPDKFQSLAFKLCHLYYNWPGTIRVPAPCQYAHKIAFLVGQYLHAIPRDELANNLYYL
uniref:Piwi-1 n=1 Tax=Hofstenia miamia TaxID=442651 RepID=A0A068CM69_HOFMI|nr:piwi-1 [Hofstenia miamia]